MLLQITFLSRKKRGGEGGKKTKNKHKEPLKIIKIRSVSIWISKEQKDKCTWDLIQATNDWVECVNSAQSS